MRPPMVYLAAYGILWSESFLIGDEAMHPSDALKIHRSAIRAIAVRHRVCNPRLFGSVLRGEDIDGSDLDLLVEPTVETTLFDIGAICYELGQLLGMQVDVLTPMPCLSTFASRY